jgi:TRAP-type mannitol/chloroaromatic compound transport system permease large subunit
MLAINLQTSFLTPPFGFALFYLRGVTPESIKTETIYKGVIPFILIQILVLCLVAYFPVLATLLPSVVY